MTFLNRLIDLSHLPILVEEPNQSKNYLFPKQSYGKEHSNKNGLKDGNASLWQSQSILFFEYYSNENLSLERCRKMVMPGMCL